MEITRTQLGILPQQVLPTSLLLTPCRDGLAILSQGEDGFRVHQFNGQGHCAGDTLCEIFPGSMQFSARGQLAFVAREEGKFLQFCGGHAHVLDGETAWDGITDEGGFAGESLVFVGQREGKVGIVRGETVFWIEQSLVPRSVRGAPNGESVCWTTQERGVSRVWRDGVVWLEAEELVDGPVWSQNNQLACAWSDGKNQFVTVGDAQFGPYEALSKKSLTWSRDGQVCGWAIARRGRAFIVRNGQESETPVKTVRQNTLSLNSDGSRYAVAAHVGFLGAKGALLCDGVLGPHFLGLGVTPPVWNQNGDKVAYFACESLQKTCAVFQGRQGTRHPAFIEDSLAFDAGGNWVGYYAKAGKGATIALESDSQSLSFAPEEGAFWVNPNGPVYFPEPGCVREIALSQNRELACFQARLP